jgi:ketosteroid isomerase-like protein
MERDRVAVIARVFESWKTGDFTASRSLLADDVVVAWGEPPAADVVCHGPEEVAQRFASFLAQWDDFSAEAEELVPIADDGVLVVARQRAVGKHSGVETDARVHIAWAFRGDEVVRVGWFFDRADALEAAGLA